MKGERRGVGRRREGETGEGSEKGGAGGEEDASPFQAWGVPGKCTGLARKGGEAGPQEQDPLLVHMHTSEGATHKFTLRETPPPTPQDQSCHQHDHTDPHLWLQVYRSQCILTHRALRHIEN